MKFHLAFVIGRKFFICDISHGADVSTRCYSIIEIAGASNLAVYDYLLHLLTELPKFGGHSTGEQLDSALLWSALLLDFCRK